MKLYTALWLVILMGAWARRARTPCPRRWHPLPRKPPSAVRHQGLRAGRSGRLGRQGHEPTLVSHRSPGAEVLRAINSAVLAERKAEK